MADPWTQTFLDDPLLPLGDLDIDWEAFFSFKPQNFGPDISHEEFQPYPELQESPSNT